MSADPHTMPCQWIRDGEALETMAAALANQPFIAIDTEFRRRDTFFPEPALLQIAGAGSCWLVDPLTLPDTTPLSAILTRPETVKVLHSGSEDLEVFEHWLGILPQPLVDTQKAAAMLGLGFGLGYRDLVRTLLNVDLAKEETQSDWLQRPLTEAQCRYAAQDVTFLAHCWPMLEDRAGQRGILPWILEESAAMTTGGRGPLAKFKSAWKLNPPQLAVLLALIEWRESEARRRDRPRNWILHDKVIQEVSRRLPQSMPQLAEIAGMPSGVLRRHGKQLLACIDDARQAAAVSPPVSLRGPASASVRSLAKSLQPVLTELAQELGMNPEILMPARELEAIARAAAGDSEERPVHWQGWRSETVVKPLVDKAHQLLGERQNAG